MAYILSQTLLYLTEKKGLADSSSQTFGLFTRKVFAFTGERKKVERQGDENVGDQTIAKDPKIRLEKVKIDDNLADMPKRRAPAGTKGKKKKKKLKQDPDQVAI